MALRLRKSRSEVEAAIRKQMQKGQALADSDGATEHDFANWYHATWTMLGSHFAGTAYRPVGDFMLDQRAWRHSPVSQRAKERVAVLQTILECLEFSEEPAPAQSETPAPAAPVLQPSTTSLAPPETVTLAWVWKNVDATSIWSAIGVCVSALLGAFWLGYRAGVAHLLKWLLE